MAFSACLCPDPNVSPFHDGPQPLGDPCHPPQASQTLSRHLRTLCSPGGHGQRQPPAHGDLRGGGGHRVSRPPLQSPAWEILDTDRSASGSGVNKTGDARGSLLQGSWGDGKFPGPSAAASPRSVWNVRVKRKTAFSMVGILLGHHRWSDLRGRSGLLSPTLWKGGVREGLGFP